jgi:hypothetical protein
LLGTYAFVKTPDAGAFDHTYSIEVRTGENTVQCMDFYYYISNTSNNAKISVLWDDNWTKQEIVEVKPLSNNQWQHSQRTYNSPLSSSYHVSYCDFLKGIASFVFNP